MKLWIIYRFQKMHVPTMDDGSPQCRNEASIHRGEVRGTELRGTEEKQIVFITPQPAPTPIFSPPYTPPPISPSPQHTSFYVFFLILRKWRSWKFPTMSCIQWLLTYLVNILSYSVNIWSFIFCPSTLCPLIPHHVHSTARKVATADRPQNTRTCG